MEKKIINIKGMHCMGCALGLEEVLERLDFIKSAKVSLENKNVEVEYEQSSYDEAKVISAVKEMGFEIEE